jgi:8-oxo-dGTP pyrophosphatase MutT (NUDIX family)
MLSHIIIAGRFYDSDIKVIYRHKRLNQTNNALQFIESNWKEFVKNNTKSFNGKLSRVDSCYIRKKNKNGKENLIELQLSDTDYKEFVGTRGYEFIRRYGREQSANPLSVGAVLVTRDNRIILGERSAAGIDAGKSTISVPAGYIDPKKDVTSTSNKNNKNSIDIFNAIRREIYEEIGIEEKDIGDLICIGLIDNKEQNQISASFYCKLTILSKELMKKNGPKKEAEFSQIIMIENSVQSIDDFINASQDELSDIIVPTLEMYKNLILG